MLFEKKKTEIPIDLIDRVKLLVRFYDFNSILGLESAVENRCLSGKTMTFISFIS